MNWLLDWRVVAFSQLVWLHLFFKQGWLLVTGFIFGVITSYMAQKEKELNDRAN